MGGDDPRLWVPRTEDGVDVGEVDGEDGVGLGGEELSPGRPGPSWRGIESGVFYDLPDGGGVDGVAEADQLALDGESAWGAVAGSSPAPFPQTALRTGRATLTASGSPQDSCRWFDDLGRP
ncbi:MAG TPA: hypothetical protein VGE11_26865, partial [Pseudonocardia sp.]